MKLFISISCFILINITKTLKNMVKSLYMKTQKLFIYNKIMILPFEEKLECLCIGVIWSFPITHWSLRIVMGYTYFFFTFLNQ
jgi:hypothetical protein